MARSRFPSRRRHLRQLATLAALAAATPIPGEAAPARADQATPGRMPANPGWQPAAPIPIATQELYPAVHGNRLVVAGGIATRLGIPYFADRVFAYDAAIDQWGELPRMPQPIHHAALISTGDALRLVGGFHGGYSHLWRMRDAVHELQDDHWAPVGQLPAPQAEGVLSLAQDGAVHLVTGQSPKGTANRQRSDHRETSLHLRQAPGSSQWETAAPIPTARNSATGGWLDGQLVVTGGRTAQGNLAVTEIYDPAEDRWRTGAPLPLPQAGTASAVYDSALMVMGGEIFVPNAGVFPNVWRYRLDRDRWQAMPDLPTARHGLGAGMLGNQLHAIGGATRPSGNGTAASNEYLVLEHAKT
jgi:hypothetical protein